MKQRGDAIGRSEKGASGECKRQDSGQRDLQTKVDGEYLGLKCGEDRALGGFEDNGAIHKGLRARLAAIISFSHGYDGVRGKMMCQQECRSCQTSVSTVA